MTTSFPGTLDSLQDAATLAALTLATHSTVHGNVADAVEAIEAKVGVDSSAVATSHDYKIAALEAGTVIPLWSSAGELVVTVGTGRWYAPRGYTVTSVIASVGTAPSGDSILVDVNRNGVTIFTTQSLRPTIADSAYTDTSGTPDGTAALTAGDYLTVDIDQVGSTVAGSDLVVQVVLSLS